MILGTAKELVTANVVCSSAFVEQAFRVESAVVVLRDKLHLLHLPIGRQCQVLVPRVDMELYRTAAAFAQALVYIPEDPMTSSAYQRMPLDKRPDFRKILGVAGLAQKDAMSVKHTNAVSFDCEHLDAIW